VNTMLRNRWGRAETRTIVAAVLRTVAEFQVVSRDRVATAPRAIPRTAT
jgi:hypothetical protein